MLSLAIASCSKEGTEEEYGETSYRYEVSHEMIVLGNKLKDPYSVKNMEAALASLYPTKAGRVELKATDVYLRFLPSDASEYQTLVDLGLNLFDHPLDYQVLRDGDYYHDPSVEDDKITWQYAVVRSDFKLPKNIRHEILEQCYIAENDAATRSANADIDWELVEEEAYRLTGNATMILPESKAEAIVAAPSGRITIVDDMYNDGEPIGVAGVKVSCNSFVKFASAYTDQDGYYQMDRTFSTTLRYRLVFQNEKGFGIGLNKVLVPASSSTLGRESAEGVSIVIDRNSDRKLFCRSVVNNAAHDYFEKCSSEAYKLPLPPANTRLWLFQFLESSSTMMLQQGVLIDDTRLGEFMGDYKSTVKMFLPDITLGLKDSDDYCVIYASTIHELAHASHFSQVGKAYWNGYISYIVNSFLSSGGKMYGLGAGDGAGYCEVGEMWGYYIQNRFFKDRYGEDTYTFGTSYWFYPHIFLYLDERGLNCGQIAKALTPDVKNRNDLQEKLESMYPDFQRIIDQAFERYSK